MLNTIRQDPLTNEDHEAHAHVFGNASGHKVSSPKKAWEVTVLKAHGIKPEWTKGIKKLTPGMREQLRGIDLHFHDLRHEAGSRWIEAGWPIHHVQQMLGHADLKRAPSIHVMVQGLEESMRKHDKARGLISEHFPCRYRKSRACGAYQRPKSGRKLKV